ncbi:hypothetical protein [Streptomyces sp. NPDC058092]|uniref:hypothetical protein n=1 Tax=Streptomyces sp. NPDC058092 TaxID=3346336 RepID=UPI0036EE6A1F
MDALTPTAEKLLREIARCDKGAGVRFRYAGRGRYSHPNTLAAYNQGTFRPLYKHGLVDDGGNDEAPVRITDAGRQLLAELDAAAAAKPKREKKPPNPESPAAIRALRVIAALPQPVRPYGGARRGLWAFGSHDGHGTTELLVYAMEKAGYVRIIHGPHLSTLIEITDAGRARLK